jgi:hypothetical protein
LFMTNISGVTHNLCVDTSSSQIDGGTVASVDSAQVIVITEIRINTCKDTSSNNIARIISTSISIIARRIGGRNTLGQFYITRVFTYICGASIGVITFKIGEAIRDWRAEIGEVDKSGCRNTFVVRTHIICRYRDSGFNTSGDRITSGNKAKVGGNTRRVRGVDTNSGRRNRWVDEVANICGTSIVVITITINLTFSDRTFRAVCDNSYIASGNTRNCGTTISNGRKRNRGLSTTRSLITSGSVANILWDTRDDGTRTEVLERISGVGLHANIKGASIRVITIHISDTLRYGANSELRRNEGTSCRLTIVSKAAGIGRNGNGLSSTSSSGITTIDKALVRPNTVNSRSVANSG